MMMRKWELPPQSLRFMKESDEKFLSIARQNVSLLRQHGLNDTDRLLDLGCGYGRLAYGLEESGFRGHYVGVDILPKHIQWCEANIQAKMPNYRFQHLDIQNDRYNPKGQYAAEDAPFEFGTGSFEFVSLFSVFTHMYEAEIRNYLSNIYEVLVEGGRCLCTFFIYDEQRLPRLTNPNLKLSMIHVLNDHTRFHDADDPLYAIAFERGYLEDLVNRLGFTCVSINYGCWDGSGGNRQTYQDHAVLEKS